MNQQQSAFLQRYLASAPSQAGWHATPATAWHFCADEQNANLCADLVLRAEKTATCSMKHWYESGAVPMPVIGGLSVVTDWEGTPVAVIRTTHVDECAFSDVTQEWAEAEGEGDKTLQWWREAHWAFFSRECSELGIEATRTMPLVMERFEIVYSECPRRGPNRDEEGA